MKGVDWRALDRRELAALLAKAERVSSSAIGATTLYRLKDGGREILALALPDGAAVIMERAPLARRRRRIDASRATPASR